MILSNETIERRLVAAQLMIVNARANAEVQTALAAYGFSATRLDEGRALWEALSSLCQRKVQCYGTLCSATDALNAAEKQAQAMYRGHTRLARIAFQDDQGTLQTLHLIGPRKNTLAGWLGQARDFYTMALANAAIAERLAVFSITHGQLEAGMQQIATILERHAAMRQQRGLAQEATRERNAAVADLDAWMRDFKLIARVALRSRPQLLEQFGIPVRA